MYFLINIYPEGKIIIKQRYCPILSPKKYQGETLKNSIKNLKLPYKKINAQNNNPSLYFLPLNQNKNENIPKFFKDSYN